MATANGCGGGRDGIAQRQSVELRNVAAPAAVVLALALAAGLPAMGLAGSPAGSAPGSIASWPSVGQQSPSLMERMDTSRALDDVRRLSGEEPLCTADGCFTLTNRLTGSADCARAMDYVRDQVTELGYEVTEDPWSQLPWFDRNILARKTGIVSPTEQVYVVAHVDGVASCPDHRCPAADDNGSGAAAILELARALVGIDVSRSVTFMFTTGEEQGCYGVNAFLQSLSQSELADIRYVVNLDMVGYDSDDDGLMELYYGAHEPSRQLAVAMARQIEAAGLPLTPSVQPGCG